MVQLSAASSFRRLVWWVADRSPMLHSGSMSFSLVSEYRTEGGPLLIADAASAAHWAGSHDDGSGVLVEYMGQDVLKLPKDLLQTSKTHRQQKQFATLKEAEAFQKRVLAAFRKLHPKAARLPRHEDAPLYYVGSERIYSVELKFATMVDSVAKRLKSDAQVLVFDKQRKAQALFVQQEPGLGVVVVDAEGGALAVAQPHHRPHGSAASIARALATWRPPKAKAKAKLTLDGLVFVFESALSQADVARVNWKKASLAQAVQAGLRGKSSGPLHVADQAPPAGAFARVPAGSYAISYDADADIAGGASVVQLSRTGS